MKKDIPLHYRNEYTGFAVYELNQAKTVEKRFEATIEKTALGSINVHVNLLDSIDYPLIPVLHTLKKEIAKMEREGKLI